jgi:hypothetical protein
MSIHPYQVHIFDSEATVHIPDVAGEPLAPTRSSVAGPGDCAG